jgi:hypothetical protein
MSDHLPVAAVKRPVVTGDIGGCRVRGQTAEEFNHLFTPNFAQTRTRRRKEAGGLATVMTFSATPPRVKAGVRCVTGVTAALMTHPKFDRFHTAERCTH